jgi:aminopeptidase N
MIRPFRPSALLCPILLAACAVERPASVSAPVESAPAPAAAPAPVTATATAAVEVAPAAHATPTSNATFGAAGIGDTLIPGQGNGGYDVQRYDIALDLDAAAGPLRGVCTIVARATQPLSRFNLDFHGMTVDGISIDGADATFAREADELVVTPAAPLALGAEFTCVVRYNGKPEGVRDPSMPMFAMGWTVRDGEAYVFSQPAGAMTWFPCNDHPKDKALFRISLRVPKPLDAVANGVLVEKLEEESARTFVWKARDPMATYLATVAIAELDSETYHTADGLEITNWFTRKSKENSRKAFQKTDEVLAFFSQAFGPYPFEISGNILTNARIPGALETQTKPVYGAGTGSEDIIAHELAHQWFGNAVCVEDWNDIWINEGIAEYAAWMYYESHAGREKFLEKVRSNYGMARFSKASAPGCVTVEEMFGANVYVRGPIALHVVREAVGDERFLALMRKWVADHLHGNATLEQFLAHVEAEAGADVRAKMEPWIFDKEMPSIPEWDAELERRRAARDAERKERAEKRQRERDEAKSKDASDTGTPEKPAAEKPAEKPKDPAATDGAKDGARA